MTTRLENNLQKRWRFPYWVGACVFLAVAAFFLWEEHRAHLLGALPYVLLLLCPIVHLFMHRGHGGHGGHHGHAPARTGVDERRTP